MDEIVRRAQLDDRANIEQLETAARGGIIGVRGGDLRLAECDHVPDWSTWIGDPMKVVLVGCLDEVVVAFLTMHLSATRQRGIIAHVYVEVGARELGLGDALVDAAITAVRAAGLPGIESEVLPGDRETKNLFERAGLTARKLTVYKSLQAVPAETSGTAP